MMTANTIQNLPVKVGQYVRCVKLDFYDDGDPRSAIQSNHFTHYRLYKVVERNGKLGLISEAGRFFSNTWSHFEMIDEFDEPIILAEMDDEDAGQILKAHLQGKPLECFNPVGFRMWMDFTSGNLKSHIAYRVKPEPVKKEIKLFGGGVPNMVWCPDRRGEDLDTHVITYTEIDGKPDCKSVKMEEL